MPDIRTFVTFSSTAFNRTVEREYFINPGNYGDDVARWLMEELRRRGHEVDDNLGQEDHGWYFTFRANGQPYDFVVGNREGDDPEWLGWLERRTGFVAALFGARGKGIPPDAARAIHAALSDSVQISDVRWHFQKDMMAGKDELGRSEPTDLGRE